jgi:hypothetical protein
MLDRTQGDLAPAWETGRDAMTGNGQRSSADKAQRFRDAALPPFNENFTLHSLDRLRARALACSHTCSPKEVNHEVRSDRWLECFGNNRRDGSGERTSRHQPKHLPTVPRRARGAAAVGVVFHAGSGTPRHSMRRRCRPRSRLRFYEGLPDPAGFGSLQDIAGRSPLPSKVGISLIQTHAKDGSDYNGSRSLQMAAVPIAGAAVVEPSAIHSALDARRQA